MARISKQVMTIRIEFPGMIFSGEHFVELAKEVEVGMAREFGVDITGGCHGAHVKVETAVEVSGQPDITVKSLGRGIVAEKFEVYYDGVITTNEIIFWHKTPPNQTSLRVGDIQWKRASFSTSNVEKMIIDRLIREAVKS